MKQGLRRRSPQSSHGGSTMEQVYYDIGHTLSVARLLTEGAIALFESEAQSLNLLAKKSGT